MKSDRNPAYESSGAYTQISARSLDVSVATHINQGLVILFLQLHFIVRFGIEESTLTVECITRTLATAGVT